MRYLITLFSSIILISCNVKKNEHSIEARCQKIIISDSLDYPTINFIITFHNKSNNEIKLFNNSLYKPKKYYNGGVLLKNVVGITPIGAFGISNYLFLKPHSKKTFLFSYSEQYPNKWLISNEIGRKSLLDFTNKISLNYHYLQGINDTLAKDKKENDRNKSIITDGSNYSFLTGKDFAIIKDNPTIEFNNDLNVDEVIKICESYDK